MLELFSFYLLDERSAAGMRSISALCPSHAASPYYLLLSPSHPFAVCPPSPSTKRKIFFRISFFFCAHLFNYFPLYYPYQNHTGKAAQSAEAYRRIRSLVHPTKLFCRKEALNGHHDNHQLLHTIRSHRGG